MFTFKRHVATMHDTTGKFTCVICKEAFPSSSALKSHGKTHQVELIKEEEFTIQQPSVGNVSDDAPENINQQVELEEEQEKKKLESIKHPCYYCEKEISEKHMWRHIEEVHNKIKVNT